MMNPRFFLNVAVVATLSGAPGCSADKGTSERPKVVRVGGCVLYNGQPLQGAHVTFSNATANTSGYGTTDADGKFTLTTFAPKDGAVPGKQQISVSKVQAFKQAEPPVDRTKTAWTRPAAGPRWLIPRRYGDLKTSGLTAEVTDDGPNEIVLELKGTAEQ